MQVLNVNEAPTRVSLSPATVPENATQSTIVGILTTADVDAGDTFTYSILRDSGSQSGAFAVQGDRVVVMETALINYEFGNPEHRLTITSQDAGGLTVRQTVVVSVTDVNDAPSSLTLSRNTLPESSPTQQHIGTLAVIDEDVGQQHVFVLERNAGPGGGLFGISGSNLVFIGQP